MFSELASCEVTDMSELSAISRDNEYLRFNKTILIQIIYSRSNSTQIGHKQIEAIKKILVRLEQPFSCSCND